MRFKRPWPRQATRAARRLASPSGAGSRSRTSILSTTFRRSGSRRRTSAFSPDRARSRSTHSRRASRGDHEVRLLTGSVLIDGTGAPPLVDSAVLVDDAGRIAAVGPRDSISRPPAAETLDVSGCTLLPGLIDCHDHMGTHGYSVGRLWGLEEPQSTSTLRSAAALRQALFCGYTTVRDAAGLDAGFKLAIGEGWIHCPRLVLAINLICATD